MIDPKLTDIMMEMVTLTLNTMDNGQELLLNKRLLQLLLHKTHSTLMNFLSRLSLETELLMTDLKLMDIMMEMVTLTHNTMDNGQELLLNKRLLHLLPHRTHSTQMSSHSRLSLETELLMTDLKLMVTMTVMVTLTLNTTDNGQELSPKKKQLQLLLHRTHCTKTNFHSRLSPEIELLMIDPKHMDIMMETVMLTLNTMDHGKVLD